MKRSLPPELHFPLLRFRPCRECGATRIEYGAIVAVALLLCVTVIKRLTYEPECPPLVVSQEILDTTEGSRFMRFKREGCEVVEEKPAAHASDSNSTQYYR